MIGAIVYREQISEWSSITQAVLQVVHTGAMQDGQLQTLHQDVRTLLRSRAGPFVKEVLETRVMPVIARSILERVTQHPDGVVAGLQTQWTHFYIHVLTTLEAIFIQLQQSQRQSIKHMVLSAFREHTVLPLEQNLTEYLAAVRKVPPTLQQMFLVLQSVPIRFPVSESQLRFEALTARAISPFWGLKGLYEDRKPEPVIVSDHLLKRRPNPAGDTRRLLQRPLSVASGYHASTLSELFSLSADRLRCKHRMIY